MKKGDEASPSIILAGPALLVKMVITLEPHYAFGSNFEYYSLVVLFTVAPVLVAISIKQVPVLSKHFYVPPTDFTCK